MARKKKAAGHHGGSWKVAYADFVTAMMAFFMVLWILGLNQPIKAAIAAYFNDPMVFLKAKEEKGTAAIQMKQPFKPPEPPRVKSIPGTGLIPGGGIDEKKIFKNLKKELERTLMASPEYQEFSKNVRIEVTREGLRIELFEEQDGSFFAPGGGDIRFPLQRLLRFVSQPLKQLMNPIVVEGHTDALPSRFARVSNWEISAERANAARRILEEEGLGEQIAQVRGLASNQLLKPTEPNSPGNRRISLLALFSGPEKTIESPVTDLLTRDPDSETPPDPFREPSFGPRPVGFASPPAQALASPDSENPLKEESPPPKKEPGKKRKGN